MHSFRSNSTAENPIRRPKKHKPSLEQDLATMLRLKAKCLQLIVTLLITLFSLVLFLLLQFEYFLERSFSQGGRDVVFAVEILNDYPSTYVLSNKSCTKIVPTYHFTQQEHILSTNDKDTARNISIQLTSVDALNRLLENKVCCINVRQRTRQVVGQAYRTGPSSVGHR